MPQNSFVVLAFNSAADMLSKRSMTVLPGSSKPCKSSEMPDVLEERLCTERPLSTLSGPAFAFLDTDVLSSAETTELSSRTLLEHSSCFSEGFDGRSGRMLLRHAGTSNVRPSRMYIRSTTGHLLAEDQETNYCTCRFYCKSLPRNRSKVFISCPSDTVACQSATITFKENPPCLRPEVIHHDCNFTGDS